MALTFEKAITRISPPWLRRTVGGALLEAIGESIDTQVSRTVEGLQKRFPKADSVSALGLIGRERRILRGPGEDASTFASRVIIWWDSHRTRGGAYALLAQLHAYFLASNNVPITLIYNGGKKFEMDTAGAITRGVQVGWTGDGQYPLKWARYFLIFQLTGSTFAVPFITEDGEILTDEEGETLLAEIDITALTASDIDEICAVPREWNAAHVDKIYITLMSPGAFVWGFPPSNWGDVGLVWGGGDVAHFSCI